MAGNADFLTYMRGRKQGFNPYAAGKKRYGGGRDAPNLGPSDKLGYRERDAEAKLMRNAMLRKIKAGQSGRYMSADYLRPVGRRRNG
jgi:hypothetical protein